MIENLTPGTSHQSTQVRAAHHIYILPTSDRSLAKLGRTRNGSPLSRITALCYRYPEIDLSRAAIVEVDSHQVEAVLHFAFGQRHAPQSHRKDGFSEWFSGDIVDEALEFLEQIACCRGVKYRVIRNVDSLIREFRARNPRINGATTRLTEVERENRAEAAKVKLREGLCTRTEEVIAYLGERIFDAVIVRNGRRYLCRTVNRSQEAECWLPNQSSKISKWGRSLVELASITVRVEGGFGHWNILDLPEFVRIDDELGLEYYRVPEFLEATNDSNEADQFLDEVAWSMLSRAISHLPMVATSCEAAQRRMVNAANCG